MSKTNSKLGSAFYSIWGLLHLKAAYSVWVLSSSLPSGMAEGRLQQGAWNLAVFALASIIIAALLNRKNSKIGFYINLGLVSATDIGFILFILVPGYVSLFPGLLGPVFWVLGAFFTFRALKTEPTPL